MFKRKNYTHGQKESGAVLVELTYVIVFILVISIASLELVNFIRHHKLAMGLSFEAANLIFKECPDIARNTLEFESFNAQVAAGGTPNNVRDCLGRNLDEFAVFLSSRYFNQRVWSGCDSPPPFVHIELYNSATLPAGMTSPMTRTINTTNPAQPAASPNLSSQVADNINDCPALIPLVPNGLANIIAGGSNPQPVVVRAVIFIPFRGIVLPNNLISNFFSGSSFMNNGGIYAETII